MTKRLSSAAAIFAALSATAIAGVPAAHAADACPNAAIRSAQGTAGLPDCRAYEKVSPQDKNDSDIYYTAGATQSTPGGSAVAYQGFASFGGGASGVLLNQYIATRTDDGWKNRNINAPTANDSLAVTQETRSLYRLFSRDLTRAALVQGDDPLTPDAERGIRNIYVADVDRSAFTLVTPPPVTSVDPFTRLFNSPVPADASTDFRHILFESFVQLTADAPPGVTSLYEWSAGEGVTLAGVLPDGSPSTAGSSAGRGVAAGAPGAAVWEQNSGTDRTLSADGSRAIFTAAPMSYDGAMGQIFMREHGQTTVEVSASKRTDCAGDPTCGGDGTPDPASDPAGPLPAYFLTASADGSIVYFASCAKLTDDSTAFGDGSGGCDPETPVKNDLYRFDVDSGALTDLTADHPEVGGVYNAIGASEDGTRVYFGTRDSDIFLWDRDRMVFVGQVGATATDAPRTLWPLANNTAKQARVSADGLHLAFVAADPLGGADTAGQGQAYLYDARSQTLVCASCGAIAGAAQGSAAFAHLQGFRVAYQPRAMSEDGSKLFFDTSATLVASDTNGKSDVYEYDARTGARALLSSGRGQFDTRLVETSESGDSVFMVTREQLVSGDQDPLEDLYVVQAGGGFPEPAAPRPPCAGDACQGTPSAPPGPTSAGSLTFSGAGDAPASRADSSRATTRGPKVSTLKVVTGTSALVRVQLPARGTVSVSGPGLKTTKKGVAKAGTASVNVVLTTLARATLKKKHVLRVNARVVFTPTGGRPSKAGISITFKTSAKKKGR